jgi:hypothetical protein
MQAGLTAPRAPNLIVNVVAFQVGWFACVLGAAHGWPWGGTAAALVITAWHVARVARPAQEAKLILATVLLGALWDSTLAALGWLTFLSGVLVQGTAPHWILGMYALFATTLNVSLDWLKNRWLVAAILGGAAGPASYWAGARLGAVEMADPLTALIALGVGWAVMMPLLMALAQRFDGVHGTRSDA